MSEHLFFALRLVNLHAELFLQLADLARDPRTLVEQAHEHFVDPVDIVAEIVERPHHRFRGFPALRTFSMLFSQRTYSSILSARSEALPCSATTETSALPTTAASA